ncbi:hypothetical protein DFH27DRAFT_638890 [Peziza echinospora]|nr:hypothetical protein DFH27DRAFT_638890 [Peziza echinospora]
MEEESVSMEESRAHMRPVCARGYLVWVHAETGMGSVGYRIASAALKRPSPRGPALFLAASLFVLGVASSTVMQAPLGTPSVSSSSVFPSQTRADQPPAAARTTTCPASEGLDPTSVWGLLGPLEWGGCTAAVVLYFISREARAWVLVCRAHTAGMCKRVEGEGKQEKGKGVEGEGEQEKGKVVEMAAVGAGVEGEGEQEKGKVVEMAAVGAGVEGEGKHEKGKGVEVAVWERRWEASEAARREETAAREKRWEALEAAMREEAAAGRQF